MGAVRAEDAQGTLTQSHISPSLLVYEENKQHGGLQFFHQKSTCIMQSILEPYVVQNWSRFHQNRGKHNPLSPPGGNGSFWSTFCLCFCPQPRASTLSFSDTRTPVLTVSARAFLSVSLPKPDRETEKKQASSSASIDGLRVGWLNGLSFIMSLSHLWEGYHKSRSCSRDTYPE